MPKNRLGGPVSPAHDNNWFVYLYTAPTREHVFGGFSTLHSYVFFNYDFLFIAHVSLRSILGSISGTILVRFGLFLLLELWGFKKWPKCHQTSMGNLASKKVGSEDVWPRKRSWAGGQEGGEGPLGAGSSEERKKRKREKEIKKGRFEHLKVWRFEGLKKALHALTRRVGGL